MQTLLRRWLVLINVKVLLAGLVLGMVTTRRAFLLVALVPLALAPFSYARWRLHGTLAHALGAARTGPWLLVAIGIACDIVLIAQLLTGRSPEVLGALHGPVVAWLGPVWFSAHALALLGYGLVGAARLLHRLSARLVSSEREPADEPASPDRRAFLQQMSVAGAALPFVASVSGVSTSYDFRVEERDVVVPGWPRALDGLRLVHLSDIHVGGGMTHERLLRVAELTNRARPDVVAHTGDFLTHRSGDFDMPLYDALARVRAPLGQWACLGNHDYDDPHRLARLLGDAGVVVLRNAMIRLEVGGQPFEIAGADYVFPPSRWAGTLPASPWGARTGLPRVLLNHDPSGFDDLPDGTADLVLSGHTHGGHVGIQLGRSRALTVVGLLGLPDQGLFARGDMRLFVTRCVGFYGYPMRVGIPPEIAVLVLRAPSPTAKTA